MARAIPPSSLHIFSACLAKASYRLQVERCLCALEDGGTLLLPGLRFAFQLHVLLPGITVYFSVELFAPRFFFATRYNREEYSLLLAAFTFCLPLSPFACRLERVVDPGQQRVEEKTPYREVFPSCFPVLFFAFRKKAAILPGLIGKIFRIGNIIQKHTYCPGIDHGYPKNTGKNFPKPGRLVVNGNHNPVSRLTMFQMSPAVAGVRRGERPRRATSIDGGDGHE